MNQRRKLLLQQRRRLKARRRFDAEYLGDLTVRFTCRTCGKSNTNTYKAGTNERMLKKLIPYWNDTGASGVCPTCTKKLRDERYPLHKKTS